MRKCSPDRSARSRLPGPSCTGLVQADGQGSVLCAQGSHSAVYVLGRAHARLRTDSNWLRRYCLELPFQVLVGNVQADADRAFGIPAKDVCEIGLLYEV